METHFRGSETEGASRRAAPRCSCPLQSDADQNGWVSCGRQKSGRLQDSSPALVMLTIVVKAA